MNYYKCNGCSFFVTAHDEHCPNCGLLRPLVQEVKKVASVKERSEREFSVGTWICLGIFLILFTLNLIVINAMQLDEKKNPELLYFASGGLTFILSIFLTIIICYYTPIVSFFLDAKTITPNLVDSERIIKERLAEIEQRESRIMGVLARASKETGKRWASVCKTLGSTLTTVQHQYVRYSVKLMEIEVVRWQNKLAPLIFKTDALSYETIDKRLTILEKARIEGEQMLDRLQKLPAKTSSPSSVQEPSRVGATTDTQELSKRIEETIASSTKLHEALLSQQAVIALKGVTPLKDALQPTQKLQTSLREIEVFNLQVAITDFTSSFKELEAEYVRVQSEEDVGQQISQMNERT